MTQSGVKRLERVLVGMRGRALRDDTRPIEASKRDWKSRTMVTDRALRTCGVAGPLWWLTLLNCESVSALDHCLPCPTGPLLWLGDKFLSPSGPVLHPFALFLILMSFCPNHLRIPPFALTFAHMTTQVLPRISADATYGRQETLNITLISSDSLRRRSR